MELGIEDVYKTKIYLGSVFVLSWNHREYLDRVNRYYLKRPLKEMKYEAVLIE